MPQNTSNTHLAKMNNDLKPKAKAQSSVGQNKLSLKQQVEIINGIDNKKISRSQVMKHFGISKSSLSTMLKPEKKRGYLEQYNLGINLESKRSRNLSPEMMELDQKLFDFVKLARAKYHKTKIGVTMPMIVAKAQAIAAALNLKTKFDGVEKDWVPTNGWYSRFIKRFEMGAISLHRVAGDVNKTGLFFQCFPKRTYILQDGNGQKIRGSKKMTEKARVTLVPCCNSTGSFKIPMVMIGKSKNPHCFRRKRIPLQYLSQKRAWMDANLFQKWFDEVFAPSVRQWTTRKVVLILDNCPGHVLVNNFSYIEIVYLPPNVTSVYQPMDMGIIV